MVGLNPDGSKVAPAKKAAPASQGYDPATFAQALLERLGVPASSENMDFMLSWMSAEGGNWHNSASYNPLNTSQAMPGELGTMGTQGNIRRYKDWQQGLDATVQTLSSQKHGYPQIIAALKANDPNAAVNALKASGWDKNHYSGGFNLGVGAAYAKANGATPDSIAGVGNLPNSNTQQIIGVDNKLDTTFGFASAFFNSDPSLKNLIDSFKGQDANDANVQERFQAALKDTPWYKTHTANQRAWDQLQTSDPTEAAHQLLGLQQQLAQQAKQAGVNLSNGQLHTMAQQTLQMYGQSPPAGVINQMIGAQVKYTGAGGTYTGQTASDITTLQNLAKSYGVPISDHTMQAWLQNIVQNGVDPTSYTEYLKEQSKSLYPTLAPQIDQGLTFQQAADPYAQTAAKTLNLDPNSVDFSQPKWMKALTQVDPKTGNRTAMSLDQWQTTLMTDPTYGYGNTTQAKQDASSLALTIAKAFGKTS